MRRCRLMISGRVQGVWYRQATLEQARLLGVKGWVKNLPGGEVEAVVEGPPDKIAEIIRWCAQGPPLAVVDSVNVQEESRTGDLPEFYIKR